eukprot:symbB.v1.2.004681.t1/scaffold271.1/size245249/4
MSEFQLLHDACLRKEAEESATKAGGFFDFDDLPDANPPVEGFPGILQGHEVFSERVGTVLKKDKPQEPIFQALGKRSLGKITGVVVENMGSAGGLNCLMVRLVVTFADGTNDTMVLKRVSVNGLEKSQNLGLAREALFYQTLAETHPVLKDILPKVLYAEGDMVSGSKEIIMEDLKEGIQSGYFFGSGSPLNWDKDLMKMTRNLTASLSPLAISKMAASAAAKLHATFWKDQTLTGAWIRGIDWIQTEKMESGEDLWEAYQRQCRETWEKLDFSIFPWDPFLRACIDASIEKAKAENGGFRAFHAWINSEAPWSLVHGDFHPANCMLEPSKESEGSKDFKLLLLDWENVGIGSGPQEIGQYLISHMDPSLRAQVEREVVEDYYRSLISCNPRIAEEMTLEQCWKEYILGGAGKWVWFMPLLAQSCPPKMTQYFHDQVLAFLRCHELTPETMPMPRT